jgi:hypothetical protein
MNRTAATFVALALLACASAPSTRSGPETFQARLDAEHEVPPPMLSGTTPSGTATFTHEDDKILYKVSVAGLSSPETAAHIHVGAPGVAGPVVVPLKLTPGPTEGTVVGEGSIDASAIKGKNADGSPMTMADLLTAMRNGGTYINVHTENNKAGEARGQIQP